MTGVQTCALPIFIAAIVNVILNLGLIPRFGINGAAIASVISTAIWLTISSVSIYKIFHYWIGYIPFVSRGKIKL